LQGYSVTNPEICIHIAKRTAGAAAVCASVLSKKGHHSRHRRRQLVLSRKEIVIRIHGERLYGNRIAILCADGRQEFTPPLSCHAVADAKAEPLILKTGA
jgi:hypothetical protein